MTCIFCNSISHFSQYCPVFASNKSRKNFLQSKKLCYLCLKENDHSPSGCNLHKKCFICFSQEHSTLFCPEKFYDFPLFIPSIDKILLSRFIQMFNFVEQYSMVFTTPSALNLIPIKPLEVIQKLEASSNGFDDYGNSNVVITDEILFEHVNTEIKVQDLEALGQDQLTTFSDLIESRTAIIKAKEIYLRGCNLSSDELYFLLSKSTKIIDCNELKLLPNITFVDLLQKIPNIEVIDFLDECEILIENTWPSDLLQYVNGRNFRQLKIEIIGLKFDVENLVSFIKTKSIKGINITVWIDVSDIKIFHKAQKKLNKKLSKYFKICNYEENSVSNIPILSVYLMHKGQFYETYFRETFTLKK